MSFEIDQIYIIYLLVAVSAGFLVEGVYLLVFSGASYRQNVNRRLRLLRNEPNRENILLELRKQRGLTGQGNYRLGMEAINRLVLQSGLTVGLGKLVAVIAIGSMIAFALGLVIRRDFVQALLIGLFFRDCRSLSGAALSARPPAAGVWRSVPRRARYDRAQPARGPPRSHRGHHGRTRDARSHRQRVRYGA